ncbi:phage tail length tape measure family protein [Agrobacterium radiobacter]|uniref:phage tail length tape measure family protein n=1 Tax=Agrobacterium radiobacter TaxID=362 RepID=UPI0007617FBD|nr:MULTISPECIES: phage tail length tape measure family protein [Agrobacterium tumefaciens complex]KAB0462416.1 phage tail protein [Agrobacterium tumefaciens]KWT80544.1 phage tail protein [Agrobacterium radiobacter]NIB09229.1 phage tail protein [Agrobacterium radiobacter]OOO38980.1 phage tail protein [Agrobacterium radiobacter]
MAGNNSDDLIISISTDLATVKRALNRLVSDVGAASSGIEKRFAATGKSINNSLTTSMQDRINSMVGIGTTAAKEWNGVLADQQKELDRLRAKYSPLFSTISNYKSAVSEIRQAHAAGAISANEMASAIQRERQAALASTAAIKGRNSALAAQPKTNNFNTSNIAAQFQDIGVTTAMGMSPIQIALQQGTQLSAAFNDLKRDGQSVGATLAGAFASVISPISLVTIGVIAAGAAAFQYFSTVMSEGDKSAEVLKEQAALISAVAERWGDAVPALRDYADQLKRAQDNADLKKGAEIVNTNTLADVRRDIEDTRLSFGALQSDLQSGGEEATVIKELQTAFQDFAKAAEEGKVQTEEVERVQNALSAAINSTGLQSTSDFAEKFRELAAAALAAADSVQKVNIAAARANMTDITTWRSYDPNTRKLDTNADPWADNIQNPGFMTPEFGPTPERRPSDLDTDKNRGFGTPKRSRAPQKTSADRFAEDLQAVRDRTEALRQEMSLIGLSNEAQTKRRTALDLEQKALADLREEARKKGEKDLESIKLSPDKIAAIEQESAAYARQSEALRQAQEQQQKLNEWNNVARDATRGFIDDLIQGESAADAFAGALSRIADALLDDVLNSIFKVNGAAGSSGGLLSSILGIFGGGGGKNYFPAAPTGSLYADGGYTGPGGKYQPAGTVHKGEVVWSQADVARSGGVGAVEALRKGYANGGAVGVSVPTIPSLRPANDNAVKVNYAPVIDARGADAEAVARLERVVAKQGAEMQGRVEAAVRSAQKRNVKLG